MKKSSIFLGAIAAIALTASCATNTTSAPAASESSAQATAGAIVYFNLDKVLQDYDMANDLRSVVETKVNSIDQEVTRRGNKLEKDIRDFQEKINKGLLTQSVAQAQNDKLQQQQLEFQNYAAQKQQEVAEEQAVMMNQIADAIKTFVDSYNAEKGYGMILATQGDILPLPVVSADSKLDITEDLLAGLNAAYVQQKGKTE